ncbi:MAG TPA: alpha/beta fold hydrolase [Blastocatellia bacterium]|nr:alpha/beta fold hydrolase [Blastocatellia bacterium]
MSEQGNRVYAFGQFRLDANKRLLFEGDALVTLTPKAFDTLLALVESRGSVLSKEELMRLVWPDHFVEENNLAQNIYAIRKALGDGTQGVRYIETLPKRGYRFVADVKMIHQSPPADFGEDGRGGSHVLRADGNVFSARPAPDGLTPATFPASKPPPACPKTQYAISTGDVNIAYQVVGDGPLDLVFVMGWVSHLEYFWKEPSFARFLTRLASFSRLILFDKRGTGLSDRVPLSELPTLEQRMTDVQAVMDAAGSERAALLGVSEGGPLCSLFAATHPERTVALAMIGTYAKRIRSEDYPWAPTEEERAEFLEEVRKNWGGPVGIAARAPSVAADPQFRDWWATYLRMGASPAAALALTRMNAEIDVRDVLPSVRVPTLVIHRAEDACLPVEGGRYVASRIPGARYVELAGNDHLPFVGNQDEILDEVEEFLTGTRPEPAIDRVLTTILFVQLDINSHISTQHWQETIDLYRTHVRRELALLKGKEVEMTDAYLLATFDGPARAVRCARALVDAAARLGLRARAGLHTGECDRLGERIGGVAIELGKAIALRASPGEVLISHTVKVLIAGSGIEVKPRGAQGFENLPGKWRLFAVGRGANRQ